MPRKVVCRSIHESLGDISVTHPAIWEFVNESMKWSLIAVSDAIAGLDSLGAQEEATHLLGMACTQAGIERVQSEAKRKLIAAGDRVSLVGQKYKGQNGTYAVTQTSPTAKRKAATRKARTK